MEVLIVTYTEENAIAVLNENMQIQGDMTRLKIEGNVENCLRQALAEFVKIF